MWFIFRGEYNDRKYTFNIFHEIFIDIAVTLNGEYFSELPNKYLQSIKLN